MLADFEQARLENSLQHREIHVIDTGSASMGEGILALMAVELSRLGVSAIEIARILTERAKDLDLFVALDSLEYLKRGGRISGARAAIGTVLSIKPIITIRDGVVEAIERPRTTGKARARVTELLTESYCLLAPKKLSALLAPIRPEE